MSVEKLDFNTLIQDDKIFYTNMHIDIQANNIAWFGNIIFSNHFHLTNQGIHFGANSKITTLASDDINRQEFRFNFHLQVTSYTVNALQFNDCVFNKEPIVKNEAIESISFYDCIFDCDVYNLLKKYSKTILTIKFVNCTFSRVMMNSTSNDNALNSFTINAGSIQQLEIHNKTLTNEFYINKQYNKNENITIINELIIRNTIFQENFKLHNCQINKIYIEDVNFEKHADFYKSNFKQGFEYNKIDDTEKDDLNIYFKAINFKGLAIFGDCTFQEKLIFKWVTFESFSHFRRTKFYKGLDLDYTNIQEEMNFFAVERLDSKASKNNTSQETYRIIKHNFEKIENKIEANKYHALELEKRKVDKETPLSEKLVLQLHCFTSRNGTNWWIPLLLIFFVGIITMIGLNFGNPFSYYPQTLTTSIEESFFETFKHIYILYKYKELWDLHPFLLAFNKFSLGYLYYQFLIAVRKDTRK